VTEDRVTAVGSSALKLTDQRIGLPLDLEPETTYDVLLNDLHVWSLQPARDTQQSGGHLVAAWPKGLHRYLVGRAEVVLRDHVSETVLATGVHVFAGAEDKVVNVTDKDGHPLILDKYGKLIRPLSSEGQDTLDELMDHIERLLQVLNDECGVPAYISYGTLLGAVRNGRLIGHDNDVDLAYVSSYDYPVDVIREAYRIERALSERGWSVRRGSGARINVRLRLSDGTMRYVDVFTSHWVEGVYYMPQDTGFRIDRDAILPLTTVELLGRQLPAPADYEALLAATYGEGWRTPDPSFKYQTPRWLARRIGGWFGGLRTGRKQWDTFYGSHRSSLPTKPTKFAKWVRRNYPADHPIIDLGAGNGRDTLWFAEKGRSVTAIDYCIGVMNRTTSKKGARELPISFEVANFYDTRQVLALGTRLARAETPVDLYGRFLLHSLTAPGRENLLRLASMSLRSGGRLFLEFRTTADADLPHHFTQGGRQFLDPDEVVAQIEARGGRILDRQEGQGLAPFDEEDPQVCRLVATWQR